MSKRLYSLIVFFTFLLSASSCGEYIQVQRSSDISLKYSYAKKYYNQEKWRRAADLLTEVVPSYSGTQEGAQAIYMLADSHYNLKEGDIAAEYFRKYYTNYPKADQVKEARYKAAHALAMMSPDVEYDQSPTYTAMMEIQSFMERYPSTPEAEEMKQLLFALQDKLAFKEYKAAELYYNMGMYMGNNYESSVLTARNALVAYPYSQYAEDFYYLIIQALYAQAENSVAQKMPQRFRNVIDAYHDYAARYPQGKYLKQAQKLYQNSQKRIQ